MSSETLGLLLGLAPQLLPLLGTPQVKSALALATKASGSRFGENLGRCGSRLTRRWGHCGLGFTGVWVGSLQFGVHSEVGSLHF